MKIELNGQVTNNISEIIDLQELYTIKELINEELDKTDRKVKIQLLHLSLELVHNRIVNISYDMAYSREIGTMI
tara:strand:- start:2907 stop:3128 length:222 start_codon:yes stop_codon:yes gene_type:complete